MNYYKIKLALLIISLVLSIGCKMDKSSKNKENKENNKIMPKETIHQFKVKKISGEDFDFSTLKGKKVMIVNTASECGLTPQYEQLQEIYDKYKEKSFVIVGFPANNFGAQEPGTNNQIAEFCKLNYGVTFPMMSKISVKGEDMHPIYQLLTQKTKNGLEDSEVTWNFQKYLIDENGYLSQVISPKILPNDEEIIKWIEKRK